MLYADWIACGVKHVRKTASQSASVGGVVPVLMNWKSVTDGCGTASARAAVPESLDVRACVAGPAKTIVASNNASAVRHAAGCFMLPLLDYAKIRGTVARCV